MLQVHDQTKFHEDGTPKRKYELDEPKDEVRIGFRASVGLVLFSTVVLLKNVFYGGGNNAGNARGQEVSAEQERGEPRSRPAASDDATIEFQDSGRGGAASGESEEPEPLTRGFTPKVGGSGPLLIDFEVPRPGRGPLSSLMTNDNVPVGGTPAPLFFPMFESPLPSFSRIGGSAQTESNSQPAGTGNSLPPGSNADDDADDPVKLANRRPYTTGYVSLGTLLMNTAIVFTWTDFLRRVMDPDGDELRLFNLAASSGKLIQNEDGTWRFAPDYGDSSYVTFTYRVSDGQQHVWQTAYLDLVAPRPKVIEGTNGDDVLIGTPEADTINALAGDDTIVGREDDDVIFGGDGNDRILAGDGNDVVYGGGGDDFILAGSGDDTVYGEDGNDTIYGEEGRDVLSGGAGNDRLFGGSGDDVIFGDDGNDVIDDGDGKDIVNGGIGSDLIVAAMDKEDDVFDGGADVDTVDYSGTNGPTVIDLGSDEGEDDDVGEHVTGGDVPDTGSSGAQTATGSSGGGGSGNTQTATGSSGTVGSGNMQATTSASGTGGSGNAQTTTGSSGTGGSGNMQATTSASGTGGSGNTQTNLGSSNKSGLSTIEGTTEEEQADVPGPDPANEAGNLSDASGAGGEDTATNTDSSESSSTDEIGEEKEEEIEEKEEGANSPEPDFPDEVQNTSNDAGNGDPGPTTTGSSGASTAALPTTTAGWAYGEEIGRDTLFNIENVITGSGNDSVKGNKGDNKIVTNDGNDTIDGRGGNDEIDAGDGDDTVLGGKGNDDIDDGDGDDEVDGGSGNDTMRASGGNDHIDGGEGWDAFDAQTSSADIVANLQEGIISSAQTGNDTVTRIEVILTGSGDDDVCGDDEQNEIRTGSGSDCVDDGDGDDRVDTGRGNDVIIVSLGDDYLDGGDDFDILDASGTTGNVYVDLMREFASGVEFGRDTLRRIEGAFGGSGDDTFVADDDQNVFAGGDGGDTFVFLSSRYSREGARDVILDFDVGDRLDLDGILDEFENSDSDDFEGYSFRLISSSAEFSKPGELRLRYDDFEEAQAVIVLDGNTDNDEDIDFQIEFRGDFDELEQLMAGLFDERSGSN